MASTQALFTGLSGLNAHARSIDVIGNNIANVSTTAFKSSRVEFSDVLYRNLRLGQPPGESTGGTNPSQVGMGVRVAGTLRDFRLGSISATGGPADVAIDGAGFFVALRGEDQLFTRDGSFRLDAQSNLVTGSGDFVLGAGIDDEFQVQEGTLTPLRIPLGQLTLAEATSQVRLAGNLNAGGTSATRGSLVRLGSSEDAGFSLISTATVPPTDPNLLEESSLLIEIEDPGQPGTDVPLFTAGQSIEIAGARKGASTLPSHGFPIDAASTVRDLMDFLVAALGIQTTGGSNPDGRTPGAILDTLTGQVSLTGNTGEASDLEIEASDIRLLDAAGATLGFPFVPTQSAHSDGESIRTTLIAFDSLGSPVEMDATFTLETKSDQGTVWRYFLESADDTSGLALGTGTVSFDPFGLISGAAPITVSIDRENTGAVTPMVFDLSLLGGEDGVTALTDVESQIAATFRDGAPIGTLEDFSIDREGTILGAFSNTLTRPLGRLSLATFTNPSGLEDIGSNLFRPSANSGIPVVVAPGDLGAGRVVGGSLELSNVDLGQEFINLILATTGYSASSRVIQTTDQLMDQLLLLAR
ncbi:MAG: flagellar hook-basal body complex protein [Phycisphaeraceae bacterium]|nr:flagellar hook-basal body complex protein [Phycisphaeraceae bacterium]